MSIVHVLLTKSTTFSRFMSTPSNIIHQQHRHNGFHNNEIKPIMGEKTDLSFQFNIVFKEEKTTASVPIILRAATFEIIQPSVRMSIPVVLTTAC